MCKFIGFGHYIGCAGDPTALAVKGVGWQSHSKICVSLAREILLREKAQYG